MNKFDILLKLKELKPKYEKEGLILLGLFGSYARDEADSNSDIDILYDLNEKEFFSHYPGFQTFNKLTEFKKELSDIFHHDIDIADKATLNEIGKENILKDLIYL